MKKNIILIVTLMTIAPCFHIHTMWSRFFKGRYPSTTASRAQTNQSVKSTLTPTESTSSYQTVARPKVVVSSKVPAPGQQSVFWSYWTSLKNNVRNAFFSQPNPSIVRTELSIPSIKRDSISQGKTSTKSLSEKVITVKNDQTLALNDIKDELKAAIKEVQLPLAANLNDKKIICNPQGIGIKFLSRIRSFEDLDNFLNNYEKETYTILATTGGVIYHKNLTLSLQG